MQIENNPLWRAGKHPLVWGCLLLSAATLLNNWPMASFGFAWDDHGYVVRNFALQDPVSLKSLLWCLTAFAEANWHPLTWLTLHLEFQFFGLNPGGYHVVNLLLHLANTLLLFALLYRTTRAVGKSLFVAALFSVHPLHIESVAWISEVKDVLSTFFFLITLHAYASYAKRPNGWRYALVGLLLALGLASKPMLVTAPFVLALLDFWPLGRWKAGPQAAFPDAAGPRFPVRRLILEKLPLLAMGAAVCVLTFLAQHEMGAVASLDAISLPLRLGNVVNSYIFYLWRMIWPWPLSFFYPYTPMPLWRIALCLCGLLGLSLLAWQTRRRAPYLLFGWLWYIGTLVPVIGIVQVGAQAMADRYTYIPSIGVFVAAAWLLDALRLRLRISPLLPAVLATATIFLSMCASLDYLLKWINEEELYQHGLSIYPENAIALNNYGIYLVERQKRDNAVKQFKKDLELNPKATRGMINLASLALLEKNYPEALNHLASALQLNPKNGMIYFLLGQTFLKIHDEAMAEAFFNKALYSKQSAFRAAAALAELYVTQGRYDAALAVATTYLSSIYDKDPQKALLLWSASRAHRLKGETEKAREIAHEALQLQPEFPNAYRELALLALGDNDPDEAVRLLKESHKKTPWEPENWALLGQIYTRQGKYSRAYEHFRRALTRSQELDAQTETDIHLTMEALLHRFRRPDNAALHSARAHDLRTLASPREAASFRQRLEDAALAVPAPEPAPPQ
jgi:tetratricopeptide (TPR) repeat protein